MSDHYTRIKCGGSPLDKNAPVVGLLYGVAGDVRDADDVPVSLTDRSKQQVELHQAVFPTHHVVGWYRVSSSTAVEASDVRTTQALQQHYGHEILFCLLQVTSSETATDKEEELPLTIYQLEQNVLIQLSQKWQLATTVPERIAIERVVREQPTVSDKQSKMDPTSKFATHLNTVEQSVDSLKDRLVVLENYLLKVQSGQAPTNLGLLRDIQSLLLHFSSLQNQNVDSGNTQLLSQLAAVAKTVHSVQGYTDKFRTMAESRNPREAISGGGGGSSRRY